MDQPTPGDATGHPSHLNNRCLTNADTFRAVLQRDRDTENRYLLTVELSSHKQGMEDSSRPETGEFAAFLAEISDGALKFRNLDVLREEDL
jgi:hypothetical protein